MKQIQWDVHIFVCVCECKDIMIKKLALLIMEAENSKICSWQVGDPGKSTVMVSFQSEFKVPAQEPAGSRPKKS